MTPKLLTFSNGVVGNVPISIPYNPSAIIFTISAKNGAENDIAHFSQGYLDGTNQTAHTSMVVNNLPITRRSSSYCLTHYALDSNSVTKRIISASLVSKTSTVLTLNFDRADVNYPIDMLLLP